MTNDFIRAVTETERQPEILVYFKGSNEPVTYTVNVLELLKTDPDTMTICDAITGEIIFTR